MQKIQWLLLNRGLPSELLSRLFAKFGVVGDASDSRSGSGLGLFISKGIVDGPWRQALGCEQYGWKGICLYIYHSGDWKSRSTLADFTRKPRLAYVIEVGFIALFP